VASATYELIKQAILSRQQVIATYDGHRREMCPHVLGKSKKGDRQALFYQFGGRSSSGLPPCGEWRCIPISGLSNVSVREGEWHTATYSREQTCVMTIEVEVDNF